MVEILLLVQFQAFLVVGRIDYLLPGSVHTVFVLQLIEYTITAQHDKVVLVRLNFKLTDVRVCDYNFRIAQ
jgi:hypothetical protein